MMNTNQYRLKVYDPFMNLWRSLPRTYKLDAYEQAVEDAHGLLVMRECRHAYPRVAIWQGENQVALFCQTARQAMAFLPIPSPRKVRPTVDSELSARWQVVTAKEAEGLPFTQCHHIEIVATDHTIICADPMQTDSMEWDADGHLYAKVGYSRPRSVAIHADDYVLLETSE